MQLPSSIVSVGRALLKEAGVEEEVEHNLIDTDRSGQHEDKPESSAEEDQYTALAIFTMLIILALVLVLGHLIEHYRIGWLSESAVALLLGLVVGLALQNFTRLPEDFLRNLKFLPRVFFNLILPPIIFDAGFGLDTVPFFNNIGAICAYAFAGTFMSTIIIASMMWFMQLIGLSSPLTFLNALIFGSIVSATDPVTVLAVFQKQNANSDLYAIIFGESALNDAVAIVLYQQLIAYKIRSGGAYTAVSVLSFGGLVLGIFVGSMFLGILFGLATSLAFKTGRLRSNHSVLEPALVILMAYGSYFLAQSPLRLSGIVALLFCGITMNKYLRPNMSPKADRYTTAFFTISAHVLETAVFIYVGLASAISRAPQTLTKGITWLGILTMLLSLGVSRATAVGLLTKAVNFFRHQEQRLSRSYQVMLWFAGLRGAMAFALANSANQDFLTKITQHHEEATDQATKDNLEKKLESEKEAALTILSLTIIAIIITVLFNGGASTWLLGYLDLRGEAYKPLDVDQRQSQRRAGNNGACSDAGIESPTNWDIGDGSQLDASSPGSDAAKRMSMIAKMREFNLAGGVNSKFSALDRTITRLIGSGTNGVDDPADNADQTQAILPPGQNSSFQVEFGESSERGSQSRQPSRLSRSAGHYQQIELQSQPENAEAEKSQRFNNTV